MRITKENIIFDIIVVFPVLIFLDYVDISVYQKNESMLDVCKTFFYINDISRKKIAVTFFYD